MGCRNLRCRSLHLTRCAIPASWQIQIARRLIGGRGRRPVSEAAPILAAVMIADDTIGPRVITSAAGASFGSRINAWQTIKLNARLSLQRDS
jgi:hypothetical protein